MPRFYRSNRSVYRDDISDIPEWAQCYTEREIVEERDDGSLLLGEERTYIRRRWAHAPDYYGPVRDDDWHAVGNCTCWACLERRENGLV